MTQKAIRIIKSKYAPSDTRYVPIVQQMYCCVPACISIVMLKNNIPLVAQEVIAGELGLVIEEKDKEIFWNAKYGKPHPSGYGTNVGFEDGKTNPDLAFKRLKIPLRMRMKYIDNFKNIESFKHYLELIVSDNKDVIACFDFGTIIGDEKYRWGHVCVVDIVDKLKNQVRLIDPGYSEPKWETISIDLLFKAMKVHTSKNGAGFWEVNPV